MWYLTCLPSQRKTKEQSSYVRLCVHYVGMSQVNKSHCRAQFTCHKENELQINTCLSLKAKTIHVMMVTIVLSDLLCELCRSIFIDQIHTTKPTKFYTPQNFLHMQWLTVLHMWWFAAVCSCNIKWLVGIH